MHIITRYLNSRHNCPRTSRFAIIRIDRTYALVEKMRNFRFKSFPFGLMTPTTSAHARNRVCERLYRIIELQRYMNQHDLHINASFKLRKLTCIKGRTWPRLTDLFVASFLDADSSFVSIFISVSRSDNRFSTLRFTSSMIEIIISQNKSW